jgi:hypothetical protein
VIVDPAHEGRVDEVGGYEKVFRVIQFHGYDPRYGIIGKPDLIIRSGLKSV